MTAHVYPFPTPAKLVEHPQANAYGFKPVEPIEDRPRVDVTGCLDGYRVFLLGRPFKTFTTLSNASRCAAALMTLDALEALPPFHGAA